MKRIKAHPQTKLPPGFREGAHTSGPGWEGYHLVGIRADGHDVVIEQRPDYPTGRAAAEDLAAEIAEATEPTDEMIVARARAASRMPAKQAPWYRVDRWEFQDGSLGYTALLWDDEAAWNADEDSSAVARIEGAVDPEQDAKAGPTVTRPG